MKAFGVLPVLVLFTGMCAVSTGAVFARMADAPALAIAGFRVGIATLILVPVWGSRVLEDARAVSLKLFLTICASGLFLALHFAAWISSLNYTSVANSVLMVNTHPIWVALLTPFVSKDRVSGRLVAALSLSLAGALMIGIADGVSAKGALIGDGLAAAGGVFAAFYLLLGRLARPRCDLRFYLFVCYATAAFFLLIPAGIFGIPVSGFDKRTWLMLVAMAVIPQLIGHSCYNWALKWFSAASVAVLLLGELVGAGILAYMLFGESPGGLNVAGIGTILLAIFIVAGEMGMSRQGPAKIGSSQVSSP